MSRILKIVCFILISFPAVSLSQSNTHLQIINGDTVLVTYVQEVQIHLGKKGEKKLSEEYRENQRLKRYVKKVYPYALLAAEKLIECEKEIQGIESEAKRRKILKKVEKALIDKYGDELKDLTIGQGRILLKLIDRETGQSSYDLVSEMRGSFSAALWQGIAKLFDHNLKIKYDPYGEDKQIEDIVQKIQRGLI